MSKADQKYEIYINKRLLILIPEHHLAEFQMDSSTLVMPYLGVKKNLFQYMDLLEKSSRFSSVVLFCKDVGALFADFMSLVSCFPAGGGIIRNPDGKVLMIFRREIWDLPKGKLDPGEKSKQAAIRECQEETGLAALVLMGKLKTTYHLYRDKTYARCIKKTKWYLMDYKGTAAPVPQLAESIEGIGWFSLRDALQLSPIHESIRDLLNYYQTVLEKEASKEQKNKPQ